MRKIWKSSIIVRNSGCFLLRVLTSQKTVKLARVFQAQPIAPIPKYWKKQTESKGESYELKTVRCVVYSLFSHIDWRLRMCYDTSNLFQGGSEYIERITEIQAWRSVYSHLRCSATSRLEEKWHQNQRCCSRKPIQIRQLVFPVSKNKKDCAILSMTQWTYQCQFGTENDGQGIYGHLRS